MIDMFTPGKLGSLELKNRLVRSAVWEGTADALPLAKRLSEMGIDTIEVSGGGLASGKGPSRTKIKTEADEAYFIELARQTRRVTTCPIILVGGFRSPRVINQALTSGDLDFVSLARPLIREPDLVNRWKSGDLTKAKCISCNGCFKTLVYGEGIQCLVKYQERERSEKLPVINS